MSRYHQAEQEADLDALANALQYIDQIRTNWSDVVAIPEVITIEDVCGLALDTAQGPQQIGDICSREEIVYILRAIADNPCGDIALVAQLALTEYRETRHTTKE